MAPTEAVHKIAEARSTLQYLLVIACSSVCTAGAVFMAGEQYSEEVRVIDVPGVSMELCGGTHVTQTAQIGAFKVLSESGIASGVRRVEAVAGPAAVDHMNSLDSVVRAIGKQLKAKNEDLPARVSGAEE